MKLIAVLFLFMPLFCFSQKQIKVSGNLTLTKLSKRVYIHTTDNSNGMVYVVGKEAVIISTPPTDTATKELVQYIQKKLKATVKACIADHWHNDAMEGVDVLDAAGIPSYSTYATKRNAFAKNLYAPNNGFNDSLLLTIGDKKIIARYFGPGHTADECVVWLPDEKVLFGGCGVKSNNAWVGNIADAHLAEWSTTIEKVKVAYPDMKTVVPGHGKHGGKELLDYTVRVFGNFRATPKWEDFTLDTLSAKSWTDIIYKEKDTTINGKYYLKESVIVMDKDSETMHIYSPLLEYDSVNKSVKTEDGSMSIIKKTYKTGPRKVEFDFKNLTLIRKEEEPKLTIVIQEFVW